MGICPTTFWFSLTASFELTHLLLDFGIAERELTHPYTGRTPNGQRIYQSV